MSKKHKHKQKSRHQSTHTEKGVLEITRSGIGFVNTGQKGQDILVRPADFNRAFHGDTVMVLTNKHQNDGGKRIGKIVEVLSRRQTEFVGTLHTHAGRWYFIPDSDKPLPSFDLLSAPEAGAGIEGRVIVKLARWGEQDKRPKAELVKVLEPESLNDIAMQDILLENGFPLHFSDDAMEDALRLHDAIVPSELQKRRDFRGIPTFTIDPADARDFDDALSIQPTGKGLWEIGVHIADVSHFVVPETALDDEAYQRATSVYLPDRVNPMLPERISNELCSLRPNEDKYTFSAVFTINSKAQVKDYWLGRTVIHSNKRFTYEEVQDIIEKKAESPYQDTVHLLNKMAQQMRKERFANGAINFSSEEVRFKLDENAVPVEVVVKLSKEAHQLIEEFMLLANKTVATHVSKIMVKDKPLPFPYRVHDQPDEKKLEPFMAFAKRMGHPFDTRTPQRIAESFNTMINNVRGTPQQHVLEQLGIRTMAKAIYTADNIGHYGLGFENYCHFTSPIRRYPDVLVHRLLQEVLDGKPKAHKKLEENCKHSSERERAAMDCERTANKYKQVEYMRQYVGEQFDVVITGVSTFGFWAETVAHKCEGLVSMRDLSDYDEFMLVETDYSLAGLRTGKKFRMGDTVKILVVAANLEKRQLDYQWVPDNDMQPATRPTKQKQQQQARKHREPKRRKQ